MLWPDFSFRTKTLRHLAPKAHASHSSAAAMMLMKTSDTLQRVASIIAQ